jgi:glutamate N-acetyltransferase/amino-acid N-acetyltransferase
MPIHIAAPEPSTLHVIAGLRIGTALAGARQANLRDLVVLAVDEGAAARPPRWCETATSRTST